MAYEFLKKLFGANEDGTPKAMTYEELETAIDADEQLKVANVADGNWVTKETYDADKVELEETKKLLSEANTTIQSYEDMDIEGIKKSASDWKEKYDTDTKALKDKLDAQATEFAAKEFMSQYKFTSPLAQKAAMSEFMAKEFKRGDDGKFLGAEDFMAQMKEANPGAFVADDPAPPADPPAPKPRFAPPNPANPPKNGKKMTLTEKMKYAAENPGVNVDTLFE